MAKNLIGSWTFLIGVVLALVVGAFSAMDIGIGLSNQIVVTLLAVAGIIIGLLNIAEKETMPFMISGIILIVASAFGAGIMITVPAASEILASLLLIFVPATIIVAIKNVFSLAKK